MKARILHTKIWDDTWFRGLSIKAKLVFLYLLTNNNIGMIDTYELPDHRICFDVGITPKELSKCKEELFDKVLFAEDWVLIRNLERYQPFSGPKLESAKEKERKRIPNRVRDTLSMGYRYPIDTSNNNNNNNKYNNNNKNKEKEIQKPSDDQLQKIADDYHVPLSFVESKWDDLINYVGSTGKKYKDYYLTLRNWTKRDAIKIKQEGYGSSRIAVIKTGK